MNGKALIQNNPKQMKGGHNIYFFLQRKTNRINLVQFSKFACSTLESQMYCSLFYLVYSSPLNFSFNVYMYITNLVCYTYFHWLFNPECQHILRIQFATHIFIGYSIYVSIYSENRRGIYVRFRSPSFGPQKTITTWLTKTEIFTLH